MTAVTEPLAAPPPVDPDDPRHAIARAKGLEQPVITGGEDPDPGPALEVDRRYGRLLVAMVVVIVASGFVIGIALALVGPAGGR
jgi:hypothetical protein